MRFTNDNDHHRDEQIIIHSDHRIDLDSRSAVVVVIIIVVGVPPPQIIIR
jgi:hypothetical protein